MSIEKEEEKKVFMETFRKNVQRFCKRNNIQLNQLAEKANIKQTAMNSYMLRDPYEAKMPSALNLKKIANALGVTTDSLLTSGNDYRFKAQTISDAITFLNNLYMVTKQGKFNIELREKNSTVISTNNMHVYTFFTALATNANLTDVLKRYNNLVVFDGSIIEREIYEQFAYDRRKSNFVYSGSTKGLTGVAEDEPFFTITEEDLANYPEEAFEEIIRREKIWEEQHEKRKKQ